MAEGKPIYAALMAVQADLKAPKGQHNSFGKYDYRSAEDIIEAVKPLLKENGLFLNMTDEVVLIGDRYYIKATVSVTDIVTGESVAASALAREAAQKKGMDESQVTGTASSYARKYALNGLFAIDDTKDADTDQYKQQTSGSNSPQNRPQQPAKQNAGTYKGSTANNATDEMRAKAIKSLNAEIERTGVAISEVAAIANAKYGKASVKEMTTVQICDLTNKLGQYLLDRIDEASA